ncbi:hypothetical protein [Cupriavidus pauculus]|uniref:Uncharacterized protein n=1 Tax=Cupriavidus pauculus TaxID=82633 RepID=A0A2N5CDJ9_9BURK|nr:hypothetical protein [Cupriavidus pauculus]PLQ00341.1 hypothetical protein CYJ10_11940 [Cupriavidus pauculus]
MERTIKNKAEVRAMVRAAQDRIAVCTGTCFGDVCWHPEDSDGCNWSISKMEGEAGAACLKALKPFIDDLRQRINIRQDAER